jgi:hypothetical protein
MATCTSCGFQNHQDARLCAGCGAPIMSASVGRQPAAPSAGGVPPTRMESAFSAPTPGMAGGVPPTRLEGGAAGIPPTRMEGGAAGIPPTTLEGGAAGVAPTRLEGQPGFGGPSSGGAPRTMLQEEQAKPISGWLVALRSRTVSLYSDIPIFMGANTVGRSPQLGQHYVADPGASSQHAVIVGGRGMADITDLGSANGTMVNRKPIRTHSLAPGDEVRLGKTSYVWVPLPVDSEARH